MDKLFVNFRLSRYLGIFIYYLILMNCITNYATSGLAQLGIFVLNGCLIFLIGMFIFLPGIMLKLQKEQKSDPLYKKSLFEIGFNEVMSLLITCLFVVYGFWWTIGLYTIFSVFEKIFKNWDKE